MNTSRRTLLAALALSWTAGACKKDTPKTPADPARPKIALVMKALANEFFKTMEAGARAHQARHADAYELVANGIKDESDVGRQIDLVERMVADGARAIVIAPADSKALVGALKRARDAGVIVVNIDNRLDADVLKEKGFAVPFVGPDNRKGARLAGLRLAQALKPGDEVAIIEGLPTAFNAVQRRAGFEDAVKESGLKVVATQAGNWEMGKANQLVAALLTEHPGLKGVLCANDSMALGAAAAIQAAGKTGAVQIIGFDAISAARELLGKGQLLATVDQHGGDLAVFGIEHALELLRGGAAPADKETPVDLVTAPAKGGT